MSNQTKQTNAETEELIKQFKSKTTQQRLEIKDNYEEEYMTACEPSDEIINIEGVENIKGQCYNYVWKLPEGKETIFNDIGFEWMGHQRFAGWDCRYSHENINDFNRKTIYFRDLEMAKTMAIKYSANSIVMTMRGFSLRWGCVPIRTNSHHGKYGNGKFIKSKEWSGATGMGVWINKQINIDVLKQHQEDGAVITQALINHLEGMCGLSMGEKDLFMDGRTIKEIRHELDGELRSEDFWDMGGIYPNRRTAEYKEWMTNAKKMLKINKKGEKNIVKQAKKDIKKMNAEKYEEELKAKRVAKQAKKDIKKMKAEDDEEEPIVWVHRKGGNLEVKKPKPKAEPKPIIIMIKPKIKVKGLKKKQKQATTPVLE